MCDRACASLCLVVVPERIDDTVLRYDIMKITAAELRFLSFSFPAPIKISYVGSERTLVVRDVDHDARRD